MNQREKANIKIALAMTQCIQILRNTLKQEYVYLWYKIYSLFVNTRLVFMLY